MLPPPSQISWGAAPPPPPPPLASPLSMGVAAVLWIRRKTTSLGVTGSIPRLSDLLNDT